MNLCIIVCLLATFEKLLEDKKASEEVKEKIRKLLPTVRHFNMGFLIKDLNFLSLLKVLNVMRVGKVRLPVCAGVVDFLAVFSCISC